MKKILLILILISIPLVSRAEIIDPLEYNGNDWKVWDGNRKSNYITGFMVGSGYVIAKNQFYSSVSFDQEKATSLWIETMSTSAQKQKAYKADDVRLVVFREAEFIRSSLSNLLIVNISSGQIIDGLDILYKDFKNRNILLADAIYVIKKQITGSSTEDIERILLYLRSDRKEDGHLRIKDEKGSIIRTISFP